MELEDLEDGHIVVVKGGMAIVDWPRGLRTLSLRLITT